MAKDKKKKWKSRIKKALKLAAIGAVGYGASKMFGGRKKAALSRSVQDTDDAGIGVTHSALTDAAPKTDWIKKKPKVIVPEIKPKIDHGMAYQSSRGIGNYGVKTAPTHVNGVKILGRINANDPRPVRPTPFHPSQGNRRQTMAQVLSGGDTRGWKKGGSVTGIAKRGFGRALMKGKK